MTSRTLISEAAMAPSDNAQGISVEELALVRRMQQLHELFAIFRLAHEKRRKTFQESGSGTARVHICLLRNEASAAMRCLRLLMQRR
jgi:hypothetical protein